MRRTMQSSAIRYDAHEHLAVLRELCREVEAATAALADDQLDALRQHVARQEALCGKLEQAVQGIFDTSGRPKAGTFANQAALQELLAAHSDLVGLNRRFAALLRRCRRTSDLLTGHYRSFLDGFSSDPSANGSRTNWTSEA